MPSRYIQQAIDDKANCEEINGAVSNKKKLAVYIQPNGRIESTEAFIKRVLCGWNWERANKLFESKKDY